MAKIVNLHVFRAHRNKLGLHVVMSQHTSADYAILI